MKITTLETDLLILGGGRFRDYAALVTAIYPAMNSPGVEKQQRKFSFPSKGSILLYQRIKKSYGCPFSLYKFYTRSVTLSIWALK